MMLLCRFPTKERGNCSEIYVVLVCEHYLQVLSYGQKHLQQLLHIILEPRTHS